MTTRGKRILVVVIAALILGACYASVPSGFDVDTTHDPVSTHTISTPVGMVLVSNTTTDTTERRRHCGHKCRRKSRIDRMRVRFHHGPRHEHHIRRRQLGEDVAGRGGLVTIYCRTERGVLTGGNGLYNMVVATGSIYRCWNPQTNNILGEGAPNNYQPSINHECHLTVWGSLWGWGCENQGELTGATDGVHCDGGCWEYMFRRWSFDWTQTIGIDPVSWTRHATCFVQVTANGKGEGIAGRC